MQRLRKGVEVVNLLEQYIEEVHSEKPYETQDWVNTEHIEVDITTNCYGTQTRRTHVFPEDYWEEAKEKGYFMG